MQVGLGRQHTGIGHILCTGQLVKCSMSCSNLDRLVNQSISTYMKYMLPIGFLAVTDQAAQRLKENTSKYKES